MTLDIATADVHSGVHPQSWPPVKCVREGLQSFSAISILCNVFVNFDITQFFLDLTVFPGFLLSR